MRAVGLITLAGTAVLLTLSGGLIAWTVCAAAAALGAVWLVQSRRSKSSEPGPEPGVALACTAVVGFLLATLAPLPPVADRLTGPARHAQNAEARAALAEARVLGLTQAGAPWFCLSRNRAGTLRAAVLAAAMFAAAAIASRLGTDGRRTYLRFIVGLGALVAVLGWAGQWKLPQGDTLWWVYPVPHGLPGPVACFINRNHFAGFLAMLCPAAAALLEEDLSRRRWLCAAYSAAAGAAMAAAALLSGSRGGLLALAAAGMAVGISLAARRRWPALAVLATAAAAGAAALAARAGPEWIERVATLRDPLATESLQVRLAVWRDSILVWRAYPLVGAGLNAFRMVYPQHRTNSFGSFMTHPENEYVELLTDAGIAGVALLALVGWACARAHLASDRRTEAGPVRMAAAGALAAALVHAAGDFPLHVPLYGVALASVMGLALGAREAGPRRSRLAAAAPALCMAVGLGLWPLARAMQRLDAPDSLGRAASGEVARALAWAPSSSQAWLFLGAHALRPGSPEAVRFGALCCTRAAELDPMNYRFWEYLGRVRLELNDPRGARAAYGRARELREWIDVPPIPEDP